jgi:hypothetical protein
VNRSPARSSHTRRRRSLVAATAVAVGALAGCNSTPSALGVAQDLVVSLDLPDAQEQCLLDKLAAYGKDELEALGKANEDVDFDQPGVFEGDAVTPELKQFYDDLTECSAG